MGRPKVALRKEDLTCMLMCRVYLSLDKFPIISLQNVNRSNYLG